LGNKWQGSIDVAVARELGVIRTLNLEQRRREFSPVKRYRFAGTKSRVGAYPFARRTNCKRLEYEQWRPQVLLIDDSAVVRRILKRLFKGDARVQHFFAASKRSGRFIRFQDLAARCCRARPQPAGFTWPGILKRIKGSSPRVRRESSSATAMCRNAGGMSPARSRFIPNQRVRPAEVVSAIPRSAACARSKTRGSQGMGQTMATRANPDELPLGNDMTEILA